MPDAQTKWIENEQLRKEKYGEIIRRGDHKELVQLIKTLYYKKQEKKQTRIEQVNYGTKSTKNRNSK